MINAVEELSNITLEGPTWPSVIFTDLANEPFQTIHCRMGPFADSAGIRIKDKGGFEDGGKNSIYRMMHNPISHIRFVYDAMFWIEDLKPMIRSVSVCFVFQFPM